MKTLLLIGSLCVGSGLAADIDLFVLAGQSNAQGWTGDGSAFVSDPADGDIPLYWFSPGISSSNGAWTTLRPQKGRYPKGHFGLEVAFARGWQAGGGRPAFFKFTKGSTGIHQHWKAPGAGGMHDQMVNEFKKAKGLLEAEGHRVTVRALIWIQGESDGANRALATAYYGRLKALIEAWRDTMVGDPALPVILGVDEQHGYMKKFPEVIAAQQRLAAEDPNIIFTSMKGLEKADSTHLTPAGLLAHGKRILAAYREAFGPAAPRRRSLGE